MNSLQLWVDAHVHFYPMHNIGSAIENAWERLQREHLHYLNKAQAELELEPYFLIAVVEGLYEGSLVRLEALVESGQKVNGWQFEYLDKTLILARQNERKLYILLGKQRNSIEGLELLTLGNISCLSTDAEYPLSELLQTYRNSVQVLPWGVGKWLGQRGKVVLQCLQDAQLNQQIWLGDSSVRPSLWRRVKAFQVAKQLGIPFLNGSDPLPLRRQERRIGSMGTLLQGQAKNTSKLLNSEDILQLFQEARAHSTKLKLSPFGKPATLVQSVSQQLSLRCSR